MRNFVQPGDNLTVTAASAVSSGDGVKLGNIFGIASGDVATGEPLVLVTTGVFELPQVSTDELAVGDAAYWKAADTAVTSTASGNTKIGVAVAAAGNPSGAVHIRLNGTF